MSSTTIPIRLQTKSGQLISVLYDTHDTLNRAMLHVDRNVHPGIGLIEPYEDTFFAGDQILQLLLDIRSFRSIAQPEEDIDYWNKLEVMAVKCLEDDGLMLRCISD